MTWKEVKTRIDELLDDGDKVAYIDIHTLHMDDLNIQRIRNNSEYSVTT